MQELTTENYNLLPFRLAPPKVQKRLLRDQQEERLVEELLSGRELVDCAKTCRTNPTGYWCLIVCGGGRRLEDGNTTVAGVDTSVTTTTTPTLRSRRAKITDKKAPEATAPGAPAAIIAPVEEFVDTSFQALGYAEIVMPTPELPNCLEFPMQVPALIKRLVDRNALLQECKLTTECLILRKCFEVEAVVV